MKKTMLTILKYLVVGAGFFFAYQWIIFIFFLSRIKGLENTIQAQITNHKLSNSLVRVQNKMDKTKIISTIVAKSSYPEQGENINSDISISLAHQFDNSDETNKFIAAYLAMDLSNNTDIICRK